jgi:outer membrane protein insertion porin family
VEIKRRPGSAPDRVILDVQLVEQSTGELSFGAGYSTSEGVIGDISIGERNLLGRGQFLKLSLSGSAQRLQATLSFTEPRFLDRNLAAGFDLWDKYSFVSTYQQFSTRTIGGSVRLGFPIAENLWLVNSYGLSNNEIANVQATASRAIRDVAPNGSAEYWTSTVGTSLTYDVRNHPKTPTSGYFLSAGVEFAGLGGDVQYIRASAEGRYYYPITEKITFVGRAIGGHIEGWGGQDVRLLDLFYKGGETIRGFYMSGYGPRDTLTSDALGGDTFWAATGEIRFPFPLIPDDLGMSGAVFADVGSLFGAGASVKKLFNSPNGNSCGQALSIDPNTGQILNSGICLADSSAIRASVGFGILWNSPLGPLRLDIAKALLKESYDKEQLVRFGASTRF